MTGLPSKRRRGSGACSRLESRSCRRPPPGFNSRLQGFPGGRPCVGSIARTVGAGACQQLPDEMLTGGRRGRSPAGLANPMSWSAGHRPAVDARPPSRVFSAPGVVLRQESSAVIAGRRFERLTEATSGWRACPEPGDTLPFASSSLLNARQSIQNARRRCTSQNGSSPDECRSTRPSPITTAKRSIVPTGPRSESQPLPDEKKNACPFLQWSQVTGTVGLGTTDFVTFFRNSRKRKGFCAPSSTKQWPRHFTGSPAPLEAVPRRPIGLP